MKVAIDGYHIVLEPRSSIAIYVNELVHSLIIKPEIEKVYLLCPFDIPENFVFQDLLDMDKVEYFVYPSQKKYKNSWVTFTTWNQFGISKLVRGMKESVDYLIAPYHQVAMRLPRKVRAVAVIHDACPLDSSLYPRTTKGFYQHYFNFFSANTRAQALIPISEYTKKTYKKHFPRAAKKLSDVVYNNVSSPVIEEDYMMEFLGSQNLEKYGYFFALGNIHIRKGLDLIFDAFKRYREQGGQNKLVLLGSKTHYNSFNRMMEANGFDDSVVQKVSNLSTSERDALYKGAIALLFPSRCEGFGYPIVEAMIQGCPPIAWRDTPAQEILHADEYLLQNLDIAEICQKMICYESWSEEERLKEAEKLQRRSDFFNSKDYGDRFFEAMVKFDKNYISREKGSMNI